MSKMIESLTRILDFLKEEADQRASAGSEMSDYEREPRDLVDLCRGLIDTLSSPWLPIDDDAKRGQSVLLGWYAGDGFPASRTVGSFGPREFRAVTGAKFVSEPDAYMPLPDPPERTAQAVNATGGMEET